MNKDLVGNEFEEAILEREELQRLQGKQKINDKSGFPKHGKVILPPIQPPTDYKMLAIKLGLEQYNKFTPKQLAEFINNIQ